MARKTIVEKTIETRYKNQRFMRVVPSKYRIQYVGYCFSRKTSKENRQGVWSKRRHLKNDYNGKN